ncbi:Probable amino acid permease 7 [Striga hermonthica]|uniref:Probable amino acid permease 7 n=1 Tax=Striga hermonthica TaxID=68872 RepID=A0A9N7R6M4_STRHE|nr:Probable amino acid permease 7 [Striga hermonthica]
MPWTRNTCYPTGATAGLHRRRPHHCLATRTHNELDVMCSQLRRMHRFPLEWEAAVGPAIVQAGGGSGGVADISDPLLLLDPAAVKRTGTIWTAVAHIITGVIGSGVLALGWSMAQLGWAAGPFSMLFFAAITFVSTFLICDCYWAQHPHHGPIRNTSFTQAVHSFLGERSAWFCALLIQISFYGTGIAYVITSAKCLRAIERSNCYHKHGHDAPCEFGLTFYMLLFGVVQIFMSQIPDFHSMDWLSVLSAAMSFAYSFICLGLGAAKVIGNGVIEGSISGISAPTKIQKALLVAQALGDILFAYPYSMIVLHIQDTLRSPPPEGVTMKRAAVISMCITTFFYLSCGGFGYAAFGDQTPGNLLTDFGFYEPYWLVDFANACVVVHLVGGYQIYTQPVFAAMDKWSADRFPGSTFVNKQYILKLPLLPEWNLNLQRLCFRTAYVSSTTAIAMVLPYFNQVLGVSGAITFWPLAIYFPVEMWLEQNKTGPWTGKWIVLRIFQTVCFCITMFALLGSIQGLIAARFS